MDFQHAHQFIRDICQVGATKAAMPSATPGQREAIRDMAVAAAELAYDALSFEQYLNIPYHEHRDHTERRRQFVEAVMRKEEVGVAELVAMIGAGAA